MDYEKIIHICQERLRQLRCEPEDAYITIGPHFPDIEMLDIDPKALCTD
jgi:hypothetical protein